MEKVESTRKEAVNYNWPLFSQFILLFLLIGFAFQESTAPLYLRWIKWDQDLSHGIPTLFAFFFLILRSNSLPFSQNSNFVRFSLILGIGLLSLLWLLFVIANITVAANTILLVCIPLIVAASYSAASARALLPTLGILIFIIPFFGHLNNLLVQMSATAVGVLVNFFGMTALLDGQNIFIPSGHIYIADGCSGLRYFTISILLGYLLSILNNYTVRGTVITLIVAIALGLITNWIRIFSLVVIGDLTEMRSSLLQDHEFFGWILFACVMFPAIYFAPINPAKNKAETFATKPKFFLPSATLLVGPIILILIPSKPALPYHFSIQSLGEFSNQYTSIPSFDIKTPVAFNIERASIISSEKIINIQLAEYRPQNIREKIIPYFGDLYNKEDWKTMRKSASTELEKLGFQSLVLKRSYADEYIFVAYRFEIGPYNSDNYDSAKIWQIPATFVGKRYSNFISLYAACSDEACLEEIKIAEKLALKWDTATKPNR